jgi:iron complex outermembrane receptor protein
MEKPMIRNVLNKLGILRLAFVASVGLPLIFASNAFAQLPAPAPAGEATAERVIVTGSNIPTAEETGPNPVDTYRPQDIEKLGIRTATDLTTFLPQEAGGTINQNIANGGDGTVRISLRGLLPKETLVLIDGKRFATSALTGGYDIQLIPFSLVDHLEILKDGASAIYGADAVAGVVNYFLVHKFRGVEIGGSYGNTNLGASNDMGEWEAWIKAGTGDDKTDIVVVADFYQRTGGLFSADRNLSANGNFGPFGGIDARSSNEPGRIGGFRLIPKLFFSANTPTPHSAPNAATSPFYTTPSAFGLGTHGSVFGTLIPADGNYVAYNFAASTPALPPADRQTFYGSFTRDLCDKYLTVFGDFKYVRSFFDASLAPAPFTPDPFHVRGDGDLGLNFSAAGISVPIQNPFNPFTVANATLDINGVPVPMTTGVKFRSIADTGDRHSQVTYLDQLFDVGLKGEMGEFGDYFKNWEWELGFRYSRNDASNLSLGEVSQPGLRAALLDTNPATAFDAFGGFNHMNTAAARNRVYVNLHNTGSLELPLWYAKIDGELFNLPAGPIGFALGADYHGERWENYPDSLNTTFQTIGSTDLEGSKVNRDVKSIYEEVRLPITSPTWNFPGFYSFEIDFAEREEWYTNNTSATSIIPAAHTTYTAQRPKVSVRWEPLDPKWIGALTLRGSYTEAFHAPTVQELSPAGAQAFPSVIDPFTIHNPPGFQTEKQVQENLPGNPFLQPEVAYEYSYGVIYSPKWLKGLTLSADWWHIDMRSLVSSLGAQFIIAHNLPGLVTRAPAPPGFAFGPITFVLDPNENLAGAIFEGLDYEAIYILESSMFGAGDFGRLTFTVNGTWLARGELQTAPDTKRFNIAGDFLPTAFSLTSSLPRNRANLSLFYDGPADSWLAGFDIGAVVHWIAQYEDDNISIVGGKPQTPRTNPPGSTDKLGNDISGLESKLARKVAAWTTLDLIASYTFNLPPPAPAEVPGFSKDGGKNVRMKDGKDKNIMPVSTAEYNPCGWRAWLNNTTITVGLQNVLDEDPPFVAGAFENGYDESLDTIKGRFYYVQLKKRF